MGIDLIRHNKFLGPDLFLSDGGLLREQFIDDLARTIATPMPRSQALRLIAAIVFSGLLPRRAFANTCGQSPCVCPQQDPTRTKLCCVNVGAGCLPACCTTSESCCTNHAPPGSNLAACCRSNESCHAGICVACPSGQTGCGSTCCQPGETCGVAADGTSICCPTGQTPCGAMCCQANETCGVGVDGKPTCGSCPSGQSLCGNKCCPGPCTNPGSPCCGSEIDCNGTCCEVGSTCINTAKGLACCPSGQSRLILSQTMIWRRVLQECCKAGDKVLDGVECCPVNQILPISKSSSWAWPLLGLGTKHRTHFCCPPNTVPKGDCCVLEGKSGCRCSKVSARLFLCR